MGRKVRPFTIDARLEFPARGEQNHRFIGTRIIHRQHLADPRRGLQHLFIQAVGIAGGGTVISDEPAPFERQRIPIRSRDQIPDPANFQQPGRVQPQFFRDDRIAATNAETSEHESGSDPN